jgi:hypothetical protein
MLKYQWRHWAISPAIVALNDKKVLEGMPDRGGGTGSQGVIFVRYEELQAAYGRMR